MPVVTVASVVLSAGVWAKLSGKHGVDPESVCDALEGQRMHYKLEPDPRGDKYVIRLKMDDRTVLLRLSRLSEGHFKVVTAWVA